MFPPVDPTRRRFLSVAAGASVASVGTLAVAAMPTAAPDSPACTIDPIYAAIERHRAAGAIWNAAVGVRADVPEGPEPMTDEQWEERDQLDYAECDARDALNKTGVALINAAPTTFAGIVTAIGYLQRQMRDDGTFMPFDIEFEFDDGYAGDGGVVLAWIDTWLDTLADAVGALDKAVQS
jgi:hypothetical protein